jgi:hypothetical protein
MNGRSTPTVLTSLFGLGCSLLCAATLTAEQPASYQGAVVMAHPHGCQPHYYQPCPTIIPPPIVPKVSPHPTDLPGSEVEPRPVEQPRPEAAPVQAQPFDAGAMGPAGSEFAGGGMGASTPMLGRGDQNNRFNLFDTQAALPQNRVWFGFQQLRDYNTGVQFTPEALSYFGSTFHNSPTSIRQFLLSTEGVTGDITERTDQVLYRLGFEFALDESTSISFQTQYFGSYDTEDPVDAWSHPQIMVKRVIFCENDTVISAILGLEPQTNTKRAELSDDTTRIYPGALFLHNYSESLFVQGGFQFSIPTESNQVTTFDYALSLGYWLYRNPSLEGGCHQQCGCGDSSFVLGIVPQIEILGKHVVGDATVTDPFGLGAGYDLNGDSISDDIFVYEEPRTVLDVTVGAQILLQSGLQVGAGFSFPITDDEVRESEFLVNFSYNY